MNELKLRKKTGDLQHEKEMLGKQLEERDAELIKLKADIKKTEETLAEVKADHNSLKQKQAESITEKTRALNDQVADLATDPPAS